MCINTARPTPVVKVTPDQHVFRGERVTLTCDIQRAEHIQWRYSWFKDGDTFQYTQQQQQSSVSELIMCLTVNTAVEERDQTHRHHTSVLLLH